MWRWVSRDPPPVDAFERPKFHTARIMVPTYKVSPVMYLKKKRKTIQSFSHCLSSINGVIFKAANARKN